MTKRKSKYNGIVWTREMFQTIINLAPDHDRIEIAEAIGVSVTTVSNKMRKLGIKCARKKRPSRPKPDKNPNPKAWRKPNANTPHLMDEFNVCIGDQCYNFDNCQARAARSGRILSPYCNENGNSESNDDEALGV